MVFEDYVSYGSGTPADPFVNEVWHKWSEGGVANALDKKLVYKSVYQGHAVVDDLRDNQGDGQFVYESDDREDIKDWAWNRPDFHDTEGTLVLTSYSGYHTFYSSLDEYDYYFAFDSFERITEEWFSNLTQAQLDPPVHATRRTSGTDSEYEYIWLMPTLDYMTLESEISEDIESSLKSGRTIERSETVTLPIELITTTTTFWSEYDAVADTWVQKDSVQTTTEPLLPLLEENSTAEEAPDVMEFPEMEIPGDVLPDTEEI